MRAMAALAAIVLFFGAAVMFVIALNPDDTPRCDEVAETGAVSTECFNISETQQTISSVLSVPAGVLAVFAGLAGLAVAATGRRGELMVRLAGGAVAFGLLTVIINRL